MARRRNDPDELDDELDDDEDESEGFARLDDEDEPPRRRPKSEPTQPQAQAEASEVAQLRAEVARMAGELVRLRAAGGLEARRDEPATVGDVLDALQALRQAVAAELAALYGQHASRERAEIAAAVEAQLLDALEGGDENEPWEDEDELTSARDRRKRSAGRAGEPVMLRAYQGYKDADGNFKVAPRAMELPPGATLLD